MKTVKTALTSFGMSGQVFHGPLLRANKGFEVVRVLERTKNLSEKWFPEAVITRNYEEILSDPEVELIVVNSPDLFHFEMAKQALLAGKHIVVEKPVAQKSFQAEVLLKLANEKRVMFTVYQNRRWDGDFLTVKKVLESGNLGRLIEFESHYDRYRTFIAPDTWKEEGDEYSGVLYNLGSHMVDQAVVLFGNPEAVTAHLKIVRNGGKVTDYYDIRLEYKKFSVILKCSYLVKKPGPRYSIYGEYGTFHKWGIDPQEELLKAGNLPIGADWGKEPKEEWGLLVYEKDGINFSETVETIPGNYNVFYNNVFDVLRNRAELLVKPEQTIDVLKILEACLVSNRERKTVYL
jgi:predicted dehydrogenase